MRVHADDGVDLIFCGNMPEFRRAIAQLSAAARALLAAMPQQVVLQRHIQPLRAGAYLAADLLAIGVKAVPLVQAEIRMRQIDKAPAFHGGDGGLHVAPHFGLARASAEIAVVYLIVGIVMIAENEVIKAILPANFIEPAVVFRKALALHAQIYFDLSGKLCAHGVDCGHITRQLIHTHAHVRHKVRFIWPCAVVGKAQRIKARLHGLRHIFPFRAEGVHAARRMRMIIGQIEILQSNHPSFKI